MPELPEIEVRLRPAYSAVMLAAGVPFADALITSPAGGHATIRIEVASLPGSWSLDVTAVGSRCHVDPVVRASLEATTGTRETLVRIRSGEASAEATVAFVDPWCWPIEADSWPLLASYVLPHDGVVTRLGAELRRATGHPGLPGLYALLATESDLSFAPPEVVRTASGASLQAIRAPWVIFRDLSRASGRVHCLDLTLLAAGVLESIGESPLILLALDPGGFPVHAMIAAWREPGRRYRPVLRSDPLRSLLQSGSIEALDLIPICRERSAGLDRAKAGTRDWIGRAADLLAVDVTALRPPYGAIPPFEAAMEATVLATVARAERIARGEGASRIDTGHLLAALWGGNGAIAAALLARIGRSLDDELPLGRRVSAGEDPPVTPQRTRGFQRCIAESRELARAAGSTIVREVDLWWAVLGSRNVSVDRIFANRVDDRSRLIEALARISPPVRPESEM